MAPRSCPTCCCTNAVLTTIPLGWVTCQQVRVFYILGTTDSRRVHAATTCYTFAQVSDTPYSSLPPS